METSNESTFTEILGDIGASAKNLMSDEAQLFKAEIKANLQDIGTDLRNTLFFSLLAAVAVLPFLAFLVLALGIALDGRYWLSALIVSIVWGAAAGSMSYGYYRVLTDKGMRLPLTKKKIAESKKEVKEKIEEVKDAVKP